MHAITGIEFWFRQEGEPFHLPDFNRNITPDFDKVCTDDPTKEEIAEYIDQMVIKSNQFFERLNDEKLLEPCAIYNKITNADVVLMQIRHIQHHIGCCNNMLSSLNWKTVKWLGYCE